MNSSWNHLRYIFHLPDAFGDILALVPIATRRSTNQLPIPVFQGQTQTVDFLLNGKHGLRVYTLYSAHEVFHVLAGKNILQRQHRNRVRDRDAQHALAANILCRLSSAIHSGCADSRRFSSCMCRSYSSSVTSGASLL